MENEYLKPPNEQRFYNKIALLLTILTFNSDYWHFYTVPNNYLLYVVASQKFVILVLFPSAVVSQVVFLFLNYGQLDFSTLAIIFTILAVSFVLSLKTALGQTFSYKKVMINFMDEIHVFTYYSKNKLPFVEEILIRAEKYTRMSIYFFCALSTVCTLSFLIVPIAHNIKNNYSIHNITTPLEVMVHFWMPLDYEYNFFVWLFMQISTTYCVILAMTTIIVFDIINLTFLYHLIGHIMILKHILKNDFKEDMTSEGIKRKLVEVTQYYNFIKRIFKDVESAFGLNIVGLYLHNLFGGGILIYQITNPESDPGTILSFGLMIPIYMGELILISLILEDIKIQSNEIPDLVYNLQWERMTIPNQKMVMMVLFQVQPVLEFRAAFNVKTGVQPAMNIIKTTFSYYVMIKARVQ